MKIKVPEQTRSLTEIASDIKKLLKEIEEYKLEPFAVLTPVKKFSLKDFIDTSLQEDAKFMPEEGDNTWKKTYSS